ncbi:MAG TPA: hypothetical protein VFM91_08880 [Propionibacteriaceae bacterium]|nr:hypothetical protein [Propionibacteriaceae bacterium]
MFNGIVIASDGPGGAARALSAAIKLAKQHDTELLRCRVEELPQFPASLDAVVEEKTEANRLFEGVISRAKAQAKPRESHSAPMFWPAMRWGQLLCTSRRRVIVGS